MEAQTVQVREASIAGTILEPVDTMSTFRLVLEYVACDPTRERLDLIVAELVKRGRIEDEYELDSYFNEEIVNRVFEDWNEPDEPQAAND